MRTTAQHQGINPLRFGKRRPFAAAAAAPAPTALSDDLRLFLYTFAAGFLAVTIFVA